MVGKGVVPIHFVNFHKPADIVKKQRLFSERMKSGVFFFQLFVAGGNFPADRQNLHRVPVFFGGKTPAEAAAFNRRIQRTKLFPKQFQIRMVYIFMIHIFSPARSIIKNF